MPPRRGGSDRRVDERGAASARDRARGGDRFTLDDFARVAKRTPLIADMKPGGRFLAKDLHAVGGVSVVLKELLRRGALHGECLTLPAVRSPTS